MNGNFILDSKLSQKSSVPLYYQLASIIKRGIKANILKPGDQIPTEMEICEKFNISRSTVRRAIRNLEKEGLVYKKQGKGSFIAEPKLRRNLSNVYSFTSDMKKQGLKPSSEILEFKREEASIDLQKNLRLENSNTETFKIIRLRLANDQPLLIETTYIPVHLCPTISIEELKTGSLYKFLDSEMGIKPHRALETYEPISIEPKEANLLKCLPGTNGYFVERIAYLETGEIFELTQSIARGDKCIFQVELKEDEVNFTRKIQKEK